MSVASIAASAARTFTERPALAVAASAGAIGLYYAGSALLNPAHTDPIAVTIGANLIAAAPMVFAMRGRSPGMAAMIAGGTAAAGMGTALLANVAFRTDHKPHLFG